MYRDYDVTFLPFRFWVGFWVFVILMVFVAFDLSFLVAYITRFTEEAFACLISIIFIYEAIYNLLKIFNTHPVFTDTLVHGPQSDYGCLCIPPSDANRSGTSDWLETTSLAATRSPAVSHGYDVSGNVTSPAVVYALSNWTQRVSEKCVTYLGHVAVETGCINEVNCTTNGWALAGPA